MLMSSMMGAIAFQKGLGLVHSTAHALGTVADMHHGLANARHDRPSRSRSTSRRCRTGSSVMAQAVALDDDTPEGFLRWLADLKAEIGVPRSLVDTDGRPGRPRPPRRRGLRGHLPPQQPVPGHPRRLRAHLRRGVLVSPPPMIRVGLSACFFHADPQRAIFKGKTLLYAEESMIELVSVGPARSPTSCPRAAAGGPRHRRLRGRPRRPRARRAAPTCARAPTARSRCAPEWEGDEPRDRYEIELIRAFVAAGKPVLGICRGLQILNVAFGGTLLQDIDTQVPGAARPSRLGPLRRQPPPGRPGRGLVAGRPLRRARPDNRQQRPPPGGQGSGAGLRGRGPVGDRRHHRGDPPPGRQLRGRGAVASRVHVRPIGASSVDPGPAAVRLRRRGRAPCRVREHRRPATGEAFDRVLDDTPETIAAKVVAARVGPAGVGGPPAGRAHRHPAGRSASWSCATTDDLAATLTARRASRSRRAATSCAGLLPRIDFFLDAAAAGAGRRDGARRTGRRREVISHEPLGVVANISAWNYPYFVGSNVFVPALLAGNAVLYKPSEHATLTGLAIGSMLGDAGVPIDVFATVVGPRRGRRRAARPTGSTASSSPARTPPDGASPRRWRASSPPCSSSWAARTRSTCATTSTWPGPRPAWPTAPSTTTARAAARSSASTSTRDVHDAFVDAFVATVDGFVMGDPTDERTYLGPLDASRPGRRARGPGGRRAWPSARPSCAVGSASPIDRAAWFEPTVLTGVTSDMAVMRDESFGPIIGIQSVADDDEAVAAHGRHRVRADRRRLHARRGPGPVDPAPARRRLGLLELLRPGQPAAAVVGPGPLGPRHHAVDLRPARPSPGRGPGT